MHAPHQSPDAHTCRGLLQTSRCGGARPNPFHLPHVDTRPDSAPIRRPSAATSATRTARGDACTQRPRGRLQKRRQRLPLRRRAPREVLPPSRPRVRLLPRSNVRLGAPPLPPLGSDLVPRDPFDISIVEDLSVTSGLSCLNKAVSWRSAGAVALPAGLGCAGGTARRALGYDPRTHHNLTSCTPASYVRRRRTGPSAGVRSCVPARRRRRNGAPEASSTSRRSRAAGASLA